MRTKEIAFEMKVVVSEDTDEGTVQDCLNAALDESSSTGLAWGDWMVGPLLIAQVDG